MLEFRTEEYFVILRWAKLWSEWGKMRKVILAPREVGIIIFTNLRGMWNILQANTAAGCSRQPGGQVGWGIISWERVV